MYRTKRMGASALTLLLVIALAGPANAVAVGAGSHATAGMPGMGDMADMVLLSSTGTSYQMMMNGKNLEVFEGTYTNGHPEDVEDIMLRVRKYSHPDNMLMDEYYTRATDDYILSSGQSGTYSLELPASESVMWEVDGPYAVHGMSTQKSLSVSIESSSVAADGTRRYHGTVKNDSAVGVALTDIIVSAQENVNGAFFGTATDMTLYSGRTVLAPNATEMIELVGMKPNPSAKPELTNIKAQGRFQTTVSVSASSLAPTYGTSVALKGTLKSVAPAAVLTTHTVGFRGASLKSGVAPFSANVTWNGAAYSASAGPKWATRYNAIFEGDSNYARAVSAQILVKPRVSLTIPNTAVTQTFGRTYASYGYLKPGHTAGSTTVRVYRERLVGGVWKSYGFVAAKASAYSTYSKYSVAMKMPVRGKWRIKAVHVTDTYHTGVTTGYRYFNVK